MVGGNMSEGQEGTKYREEKKPLVGTTVESSRRERAKDQRPESKGGS